MKANTIMTRQILLMPATGERKERLHVPLHQPPNIEL